MLSILKMGINLHKKLDTTYNFFSGSLKKNLSSLYLKRFKSLFDRLTNTYPTATRPKHVLPIKKGRKTTEAIMRSGWIFTRAAVASERAPVQTGSGHASCVISERHDIPLWCNTAIYWPRETTATTTRASSRLFQVIITSQVRRHVEFDDYFRKDVSSG